MIFPGESNRSQSDFGGGVGVGAQSDPLVGRVLHKDEERQDEEEEWKVSDK